MGAVMHIVQLLREQANQRPHLPALIEGVGRKRRTCTFAELDHRSARVAQKLRSSALVPGDIILIGQPLSINLYVLLAGVFRAGLVAMVVDPSAGRTQLDACCSLCAPDGFAGPAKAHLLRLLVPGVRRIPRAFTTDRWPVPGTIRLDLSRSIPASPQRPFSWTSAGEGTDAPALITFTSGSTGQPKAIVRTHGLLTQQYRALKAALDLSPGHVDVAALPIFVLANLAAGVTSLLPEADLSTPGDIDPRPVLEQMRTERPTRMTASPAFIERLLEANGASVFDTLEHIYTGGAPVHPSLLHRLGEVAPRCEVTVVYGSSEAEPIAHIDQNQLTDHDWRAMRQGHGLLVGTPVPSAHVRVLPDRWGIPLRSLTQSAFDDMSCPSDTPGEIVVSGPHVLPGYLHGRGDEDNKFDVDGTRWHRTGDAGYFDDKGRLWLVGRCNAKIEDVRGTCYPLGVEMAAQALPGVRRAALVARKNCRMLIVEPESSRPPEGLRSTDQLATHDRLQAFVAENWMIDSLYFVGTIPVDRRHNGKVDYPSLRGLLDRPDL